MRSYAHVVTSIWTDPDFCARSAGAQRTYFMLFSQPDINAAGILPLTIKRWALTVKQSERKNLASWLNELTAENFVVVDDSTEELLVRSFIKWDHGYNNQKRIPVILDGMRAVRSLKLASILRDEARKVELDVSSVFPQVNTLSPYLYQETDENPDRQSLDDRVVVTYSSSTPNPQTATSNPSSVAKGKRLASDWEPTPEQIRWVQSECPTVDGRTETLNFKDYWIAKAGKDATKVDWPATYRRWMREAVKRSSARSGSRPSTTDQRINDGRDVIRRLAEQEATQERNQIGAS